MIPSKAYFYKTLPQSDKEKNKNHGDWMEHGEHWWWNCFTENLTPIIWIWVIASKIDDTNQWFDLSHIVPTQPQDLRVAVCCGAQEAVQRALDEGAAEKQIPTAKSSWKTGGLSSKKVAGWWFWIFFLIFIPIWGRFPIWLTFFKWVETTN